jgi:hypothetical protein
LRRDDASQQLIVLDALPVLVNQHEELARRERQELVIA